MKLADKMRQSGHGTADRPDHLSCPTCAADAGKFIEYHSAVFAGQPAEEGTGYTDAQLTEFANTSGITGGSLTTWQECTSCGNHAQYVTDVQTNAEKAWRVRHAHREAQRQEHHPDPVDGRWPGGSDQDRHELT